MYKLFLILFFTSLISIPPLTAQDDLYGDKYIPKEKKQRAKTSSPSRPYYSKNVPSQNIGWNDAVSSDSALLFICRKFETNKTPISIYLNDLLIGELNRDTQFNYKTAKEGNLNVKVTADGISRSLPLTIQGGHKYFIEISSMNPALLTETSEEIALENFRPSSVIRIAEKPIPAPSVEKPAATGLLLSPQGYILSAYRSSDSSAAVYVKLAGDDQKKYSAQYLLTDPSNHIALLKITDSISIDSVSYNFNNQLPATGDTMYLATNNLSEITTASVSSVDPRGTIRLQQLNPSIYKTRSGTVVLDKEGAIIGMVVEQKTDDITVVQTSTLQNLAGKIDLPLEVFVSQNPTRTFTENISVVQRHTVTILFE